MCYSRAASVTWRNLAGEALGLTLAHMTPDATQATAETTTTKPSPQQRLEALAAEKAVLLEATDRPDFVYSNQVPDDEAEDAHLEDEEEIDDAENSEESDEQSEEEVEAEEESQADEDEQDPDPEEEEQQQQSGKKPTQFRLRPKDDVEKRALELRKRNLDMSLKDALAQAEAELTPSSSQQQEEQAAPLDIAAIHERRKDIRTKIKDARVNLDFETLNALEDELETIDQEELPQAQVAQARREQEAAAAATAKWQESSDTAAAAYPDAAKANSPLFTRMAQIDAELKARNDPLFFDSQKPLIIAQMAARELRIAPRPVSSAKKPVARQAPMTAPLKAGQRGAPQVEESSTIKAIRAVKDPEALAALRRQIIGS